MVDVKQRVFELIMSIPDDEWEACEAPFTVQTKKLYGGEPIRLIVLPNMFDASGEVSRLVGVSIKGQVIVDFPDNLMKILIKLCDQLRTSCCNAVILRAMNDVSDVTEKKEPSPKRKWWHIFRKR